MSIYIYKWGSIDSGCWSITIFEEFEGQRLQMAHLAHLFAAIDTFRAILGAEGVPSNELQWFPTRFHERAWWVSHQYSSCQPQIDKPFSGAANDYPLANAYRNGNWSLCRWFPHWTLHFPVAFVVNWRIRSWLLLVKLIRSMFRRLWVPTLAGIPSIFCDLELLQREPQ